VVEVVVEVDVEVDSEVDVDVDVQVDVVMHWAFGSLRISQPPSTKPWQHCDK